MDVDIRAAVPDRVEVLGLSTVMQSDFQMKKEIFRAFKIQLLFASDLPSVINRN